MHARMYTCIHHTHVCTQPRDIDTVLSVMVKGCILHIQKSAQMLDSVLWNSHIYIEHYKIAKYLPAQFMNYSTYV